MIFNFEKDCSPEATDTGNVRRILSEQIRLEGYRLNCFQIYIVKYLRGQNHQVMKTTLTL